MKRFSIFCLMCLVLCLCFGCQEQVKRTGASGGAVGTSGVEVIIVGGGAFPESLAGVWRSDKHGWEFRFLPDGTIATARISMGRQRVRPGKSETIPLKEGSEGVYTAGVWVVQYTPASRELAVDVVMDHIRMEMGANLLEGSQRDTLFGTINAAGDVWEVQWHSYPEYVSYAPEPKKLTVDEDRAYVGPLIFKKIADSVKP